MYPWRSIESRIKVKVPPAQRTLLTKLYGDGEEFWGKVGEALDGEDVPQGKGKSVLNRVCVEVADEEYPGIPVDMNALPTDRPPYEPPVVPMKTKDEYFQPANDQVPAFEVETEDPLIQIARKFNWLRAYIDYCGSLTDAPLRYHLLTGLALIAAAAGNTFRFYCWGVETFPILYSLLIGESGNRKSTCLRRAKDILKDACPGRIAPDTFSEEGLITFLALNPACLMTIDELSYLMKTGKKDTYRGTRELITSLYGETFTRRQLSKKNFDIDRPALSLITSTNVDLLAENLTEEDIFGGFLARFIVSVNPPMHNAERVDSLLLHHVRASLVDALERISTWTLTTVDIAGQQQRVEAWRIRLTEGLKDYPRELLPFLPRLDALAYRLALLLRLADGIPGPRAPLEEKEVVAACAIAEVLTGELLTFLRDEIVGEEAEKIMRKFLFFLYRKGGRASRTEFLKFSHMKKNQFDSYLNTLIEREEIRPPYVEDDKEFYELSEDGWAVARRRLES